MDNKKIKEMKRIYGNKLANLYMLELNGFKVPPFMYIDERYIEEKEYKYIYKDKYFKNNLKNEMLAIRTSIFDEIEYNQYIFMSYLNKKEKDLQNILEIFYKQFKKIKEKNKRIFVPGIIIQKMIPEEYVLEININKEIKQIIIKENKNNNKSFNLFKKINDINIIDLDKKNNNKLVKLLTNLTNLNIDFKNINLKIILHKDEWNIISFNYY